jgi:nicotinate-nucleotide pyrophosphorylase (carboxylating)
MQATIDHLIDLALQEDIGSGDVTTECTIEADQTSSATIVAKETLVVAGLAVAARVFERLDGRVDFTPHCDESDHIAPGYAMVTLEGPTRALLSGERVALNFLQRLSGIATWVHAHVEALGSHPVRLVDTRKTTPGWRVLEKYAVRVGGGHNHRFGLYDGVLIKDNHIAACGSITAAVARVRARGHQLLKIEVEVSDLRQVAEALSAGVDVIMLDNMENEAIRAAVKLIARKALVEVSGEITRQRLAALAETGVDIISMGALTHSAPVVDISMRIQS